jgi:starch synthase (maltosyl-transferring)
MTWTRSGRQEAVLGRITIDDIRPRTPTAKFPAKAAAGEAIEVSADIFKEGHDILAARVRWRCVAATREKWQSSALVPTGNDRWSGVIVPVAVGPHAFVVDAWTDRHATVAHRLEIKRAAGQPIDVEEAELTLLGEDRGAAGAVDLTSSAPLALWVDRERALTGAWYELFPRSEGGFKATKERLPALASMGFDVVYLPPIHPIGHSFRKGRDNSLEAGPDDPGSPWAIGSAEGGHTAIDPDLGTATDFADLVAETERLGMEIALDYALQCSPDHPWVTEHPEWFHHRPDGTIAYAENPPKKYQDIYPLNFWPPDADDRQALWAACKEILDHWIGHGVRIFRVDNPHTKPLAFWAWVIPAIQAEHPAVIFLAEAFTRPKIMAKLAEVGFTQSYTYFTWRTAQYGEEGLRAYLEELAHGPKADYMRPNFWPNTPDILSGPLRHGGPAAFRLRLLLAALLSPSYGIYSGYELIENEPASEENEEYLHSEKYEIKARDWDRPSSIAPFITAVNAIRRAHPAFARLRSLHFHHSDNPAIMAWSKRSDDGFDTMLVIANLDPDHAQETKLWLDLDALGVSTPITVTDELTGHTFGWQAQDPYIRLDPWSEPAHVLHVRGAEPI